MAVSRGVYHPRNTCCIASPTVVESVGCFGLLGADSVACRIFSPYLKGKVGGFFELFQVVKISHKGICMKCEICNFMRAHSPFLQQRR